MKLFEALQNGFLDQFWLVTPRLNAPSTNGVMYTGEAVVIADRIGELDSHWVAYWISVMGPCEVGDGGVLRRTPTDNEEEGPDDYYGYLAAAKRCDKNRARKFLWHGLTHFGFYNTDGKLRWADFLWRQPQMITHALWAAGLPTGPFRLFFIASLLFAVWKNAPSSDTDARRLGWLLIRNWDGKGRLCALAVKRWRTWLYSDYPNGMKDVAAIYYGAGHPFISSIPKL